MSRDGHMYQWDRIEDPEVAPHNYVRLIFEKVEKAIQCRKDSFFQQMVLEQLDIYRQNI